MRMRTWLLFAVGVCVVFLFPVSLISQALFVAQLDSAQEAAVFTLNGNVQGKGTGVFVLNSDWTQLSYQVTVHGLSGPITGAHIHNAAAGVSGNVVKNLSFTNNTAAGVWSSTDGAQPFTDSLLSELVRGRLYVNVHTSANGNGEIRGQMLLKTSIGFTAKLDSAQEAAVFTLNGNVPGRGTFSLTLGTDGQASYSGTVSALSGSITGSHIHNAAAGVSGGVIKGLTFDATSLTTSGAWASTDVTQAFTDVLLRELFRGRLYVNVHTSTNSNGEIRGQLGGTGLVTSVRDQISEFMPSSFRLGQNYPNPFNPSTVIEFDLPSDARVAMRIFNLVGQEVALLVDEVRSPGTHRIVFDAQSLPTGIYFYRISVDGVARETKKMILLR
jgi:Cu/Zn superoxide dismutase